MFSGKWIVPKKLNNNMHILFCKSFFADGFNNARIKICARDYYKLYINSQYVGQGPAPSYSFAQNYNEYDITDYIKNGENTVEVFVFYQGLINRVWESGNNYAGLIADVFINNELFLCTDESWKYRIDNSFTDSNVIGYDTAYLENRDMRLKPSEFKSPKTVKYNLDFKNAPFPALQITIKKVAPEISDNKYFYDFLQEYVCNIKVKAVSDESGRKIIIRCAEELDEKGNIKYDMRCGCKYEEYCILDEGENVIEQYDYKALRYLEIEAESGVNIEAEILIRHYPFKDFNFNSNNEKLNKVLNLCKNTVLLGAQEVFVDCPTREKGQYLGDVFVSGVAHYYLTKDKLLLKKALEDFASSIEFCGRFLSVAPCSYKQEIADYSLIFSNAVYKYYRLTGDAEFLRKMLPACEFINRYYAKYEDGDGLLINADNEWNLVDWPENAKDGYEFGEKHAVLNAHYINSVINEEKIKKALDIAFEEKSYALKASFNSTFLSKETGLYVDNSYSNHSAIHSNMLPLAFGICEDENVGSIADYLINRGMVCSVYMSYFFLKALCFANRKSEALGFITSEGSHSWLNMINEGATTLFEAWRKEEKWNTSLFHPWGSAPILIYFENLENDNII